MKPRQRPPSNDLEVTTGPEIYLCPLKSFHIGWNKNDCFQRSTFTMFFLIFALSSLALCQGFESSKKYGTTKIFHLFFRLSLWHRHHLLTWRLANAFLSLDDERLWWWELRLLEGRQIFWLRSFRRTTHRSLFGDEGSTLSQSTGSVSVGVYLGQEVGNVHNHKK